MNQSKQRNIWKIRTVKDYPQAHNHLIIGKVLQMTNAWVKLSCKTFHFGSSLSSHKSVKAGVHMTRIIPWQRIEVINEIDADFDFPNAKLESNGSEILLKDANGISCTISSQYE